MSRAIEAVRKFLAAGDIRYGIKFGLAGMLAVFLSLVVRLQEPTWALFTVYVLMIAQYVGAIAEKSIFRIIGTTVGGVLGYLVTASLEQTPMIFLPLIGIIVGTATAMFGQSRYPYAFLLCALTMVVVVSNGLNNPEFSWWFMLLRIEEVSVGILSVILVHALFWPRFARIEFGEKSRAAFADLRDCFTESAKVFLDGGNAEALRRAEQFPARITELRGLLDFGARESAYFRHRLPTYSAIATCLSRIASAIVTLGNTLPTQAIYRTAVADELRAVHNAIASALDGLSDRDGTPEIRREHRGQMQAAIDALNHRLDELRNDPHLLEIDPEIAMAMGIHMLALMEIREHIHRAHELLDSLPADPTEHSREMEAFTSPAPPPFWMRTGIKAGIATMVALLIANWVHPPGATMFILGAWVFTALDATSPGGQGDRRSFHYVIYNVIAMIALALIILAARPMLSSYAVMNIILFTWLFVWGFLSYSVRGMTIPMQLGMLASVGILSLNGQEPIPFQAVVDFCLGLVLSQILAAVIQRVLWPSLPQWELRDRFIEYLQNCRLILEKGPDQLEFWKKVRLALIPGEALQRIGVLREPICPAGEPAELASYLGALQRIGNHLVVTVGKLAPLLPAEHSAEGLALIREMEQAFDREITTHLAALRKGSTFPLDTTAIQQLLTRWSEWVGSLRRWMLGQKFPPIDILRIVGLSGRYEQAGRDLVNAAEQAARLRMPLYMGDYAL